MVTLPAVSRIRPPVGSAPSVPEELVQVGLISGLVQLVQNAGLARARGGGHVEVAGRVEGYASRYSAFAEIVAAKGVEHGLIAAGIDFAHDAKIIAVLTFAARSRSIEVAGRVEDHPWRGTRLPFGNSLTSTDRIFGILCSQSTVVTVGRVWPQAGLI